MTVYKIDNQRRIEPVDLQPFGNTISVEAPSDNPFEEAQDIEVYTQMSGGMAGPDRRQRSKRVITRPPNERMVHAGRVPATRVNAPAHRQHAGFMPGLGGLGADPVIYGPPAPAAPDTLSTILNAAGGVISTAGQVAGNKFSADAAAAQARAADANARAAASQAQQASMMSKITGNVAQHSGIASTGLIIAGIAAVGAVLLFVMKKKKGK